MKNNHQCKLVQAAVFATGLGSGLAVAGPIEITPEPPAEVASDDVVSGSLNLDFNSHFFSYGNDVWNDGEGSINFGFYPSAELAFALPANLTATLGVWAEVHDKPGTANPLGGDINEVDVWAGLSYTTGPFTVGVTYQQWYYNDAVGAGDVEEILDISFAYDTFLSPSLLIHHRLSAGGAGSFGGDEGTIAVLGLEHGFDAGPVSISFPFSIAYFFDDGYHAANGDSGVGYASIGMQASMPLEALIGDSFGDWTASAGVTYYAIDGDVVGNGTNTAGNGFYAFNMGLGLSF